MVHDPEHPPAADADTAATLTAQSQPLSHDEHLIRFVRDLETFCPRCAYNLRYMTRPECPEYGHKLRLDVRSAEPYLRWWVLLLVGLAMPAGPALFSYMVFVIEWINWGWPLRNMFGPGFRAWSITDTIYLCYVIFVILTPWLTLAVIFLRRRFCRLSPWPQRVVGSLPMAINVAFVTFFVVYELIW